MKGHGESPKNSPASDFQVEVGSQLRCGLANDWEAAR